jgi:hypothetical protein
LNTIFDIRISSNYKVLYDLIEIAQKESYEMGRRISRTYAYKKSREPAWGKMRGVSDNIVANPQEQKISKLIKTLGTAGSSFTEAKNLINEIGVTVNKEPFEILEYTGRQSTEIVLVNDRIPYGMSVKNIIDTLKYYEIRRRKRLNWTNKEIQDILDDNTNVPDINIDNLCNDFAGVVNREESVVQQQSTAQSNTWIRIWFVPEIGLPPNVRLPAGMTLPTEACEIHIPRV